MENEKTMFGKSLNVLIAVNVDAMTDCLRPTAGTAIWDRAEQSLKLQEAAGSGRTFCKGHVSNIQDAYMWSLMHFNDVDAETIPAYFLGRLPERKDDAGEGGDAAYFFLHRNRIKTVVAGPSPAALSNKRMVFYPPLSNRHLNCPLIAEQSLRESLSIYHLRLQGPVHMARIFAQHDVLLRDRQEKGEHV